MLLQKGSEMISLFLQILLFLCFVQFSTEDGIYGSDLNASPSVIFNGIGYKMCINKCAIFSSLHCKSFSYNMDDYSCNIYDEDTNSASLVTGPDTWYWIRANIPANSGGPCKANSCSKRERCVVLHGGRTKCLLNECEEPPAVTNAIVDPGKTAVKTVRTYTCVQGYSLTGTGSVTCKANGNWTSPTFTCNLVSCGAPPAVNNANVDNTGLTSYGANRTYTCNTGYNINGPNYITCGGSGSWSAVSFTCNIQDCGTPPTVTNANSPSYTATTYLSTAQYTCVTGYTMGTSNGQITCAAGPAWQGMTACVITDCGTPPTVTNANSPSYTATTYLSTAQYTCVTGYTMGTSSGQINCAAGPAWQGMPTCVLQDCGTPPTVTNANSPSYTATTYLSTAQYTCVTGYTMGTSSGQINCAAGPAWQGMPTCVLQDCGTPPTVTNANSPSYTATTYLSTAQYTCVTGYTMGTSNGQITCAAGPAWQGMPTCVLKDCGTPPTLSNGSPSYSSTTYLSTVTYTCATNYALSPAGTNGQITCPSSGTWPSLGFTCGISGCSGTTYNGKCYTLSSTSKSWSLASSDCQAQGGNLIDITTLAENDIMKQIVGAAALTMAWLGGTDANSEGTYKWSSNNQALTYTDWYGSDPDGGTGQNCICTYTATLQWIDNSCTSSLRYICEK